MTDNFGHEARPRVAWHIDTFGHSSEQAALFATMGFDGLFFARIDYQDMEKRRNESRMEMVWRGSPMNLMDQSDIFTGVLFYEYNPPPEMCFDTLRCHDDAVVNNPNLFTYNLDYKVEKFVNDSLEQAASYRTNNIMFTMGSDFQWEDAASWYKNLDILINTINTRYPDRFKLFYSTPTRYLEAVHAAGLTWELKTDDFLPYGIHPYAYFSGYFTSRPALKYYVREMNGFLQTCRHWEVFTGGPPNNMSSNRLSEAMGVAQHHDAVSGTERQHVADDYALRLSIGQKECQRTINVLLNKVVPKGKSPPLSFDYCDYLNLSVCELTYTNNFDVVVYNPLPRANNLTIAIPVSEVVELRDSKGVVMTDCDIQLIYQTPLVKAIDPLPLVLMFKAALPPLGYATYFARKKQNSAGGCNYLLPQIKPQSIVMRNEFLEVAFDEATGRIQSITNLALNTTLPLDQQFFWYNASAGNNVNSSQASGPYIFRPNSSHPFPVNKNSNKATVTVINGTIHQSVSQIYSDFARQSVHLYKGANYLELEYIIGPIPISDGLGKEIISRFDTDLVSNGIWYTDANGREMQKRIRDYRKTWSLNNTEPVASNYYPVNSRMYLQDLTRGLQLTVLTDRSQGGSSLKDGSLELMLHRRLLYDDHRGVVEPLNEPGMNGTGLVISGKHWIVFDSIKNSGSIQRTLGEQMLLRPTMAFHRNSNPVPDYLSSYNTMYSAVSRELSPNVRLLTLQYLEDSTVLLRLEHQFEVGEDATLSNPVTIRLDGLFSHFTITNLTELTLGANERIENVHRLKWNLEEEVGDPFKEEVGDSFKPMRSRKDPDKWTIVLNPMEIRTFQLNVSYLQ